jgi:transcriptional regulator with XRE-family HTH domain
MGKSVSAKPKDSKQGKEVSAIMDTEKWFNEKLTALEDDPDFRLEEVILDLTEQISVRMKEKRMTRAKLAELLGVTPAAVTKLLNGNPNFTLKTLLKVADALDLKFNASFSNLKSISKPVLVYPFREAVKIQNSIVPTANDDIYPSREQPKIPFSWNSDDSTMIPRYGGSLRC